MAIKRPNRAKSPPAPALAASPPSRAAGQKHSFRLYVAGQTGRSALALQNLQAICDELLAGRYTIEVVDLLKHPELASTDEIIAIPTLVRRHPKPFRKILGDLSDRSRVLVGLDLLEHRP